MDRKHAEGMNQEQEACVAGHVSIVDGCAEEYRPVSAELILFENQISVNSIFDTVNDAL